MDLGERRSCLFSREMLFETFTVNENKETKRARIQTLKFHNSLDNSLVENLHMSMHEFLSTNLLRTFHSGLPEPYAGEHTRFWLHWPQHPFMYHQFPYIVKQRSTSQKYNHPLASSYSALCKTL